MSGRRAEAAVIASETMAPIDPARHAQYKYMRRIAEARSAESRLAKRRANQKCEPHTGSATSVIAVNTASCVRLFWALGSLNTNSKTVYPSMARPAASNPRPAALTRYR